MWLSTFLIIPTVSTLRIYVDFPSLWDFEDVPPFTHAHLKTVYLLLAGILTSSTCGYLLALCQVIGDWYAVLGTFLIAVVFCFIRPLSKKKRVSLLITGALFEGAFVGPCLNTFFNVDKWLVLTIYVGISLVICCFWASSLWTQHLRLMYMGGVTQSFLAFLIWMAVASAIFGSVVTELRFESLSAIVCFAVYMPFYSQTLVGKNRRGDRDCINHVISLFTETLTMAFNAYFALWAARLRTRVGWNFTVGRTTSDTGRTTSYNQ